MTYCNAAGALMGLVGVVKSAGAQMWSAGVFNSARALLGSVEVLNSVGYGSCKLSWGSS